MWHLYRGGFAGQHWELKLSVSWNHLHTFSSKLQCSGLRSATRWRADFWAFSWLLSYNQLGFYPPQFVVYNTRSCDKLNVNNSCQRMTQLKKMILLLMIHESELSLKMESVTSSERTKSYVIRHIVQDSWRWGRLLHNMHIQSHITCTKVSR